MPLEPPVLATDHIEGNPDAPITLLEYGDYQCPYCGQAYPIVKRIQELLGDRLKFAFRNFPLTQIHPQAKDAAVATEAADRQGKYWGMHDLLFENQKRLNRSSLAMYAEQLELDLDAFKNDMDEPVLAQRVEDDFYSGMRSGVNATPTFFINGEKYTGNWYGEEFISYLQELASRY